MQHILQGVITRRSVMLAAGAALATAAVGTAHAETTVAKVLHAQATAPEPSATFSDIKIGADENILGKADAPVTIIEYASLTCPACGQFHNQIMPGLKKEYVDTGKVRLVYRDFPLDRYALAASMLARCAGPDRYFGFIDVLYRNQSRWTSAQNRLAALEKLARLGGMSTEQVQTCLRDQDLQRKILQQRIDGNKEFQISGTPTIIINGQKFDSALSLDQLRAVIDPMLPKS